MARHFDTTSDLIRAALHYALQDRESLLDAMHKDDNYYPEVKAQIKEFKAYLAKRFNEKTQADQELDEIAAGRVTYVSLEELQKRALDKDQEI